MSKGRFRLPSGVDKPLKTHSKEELVRDYIKDNPNNLRKLAESMVVPERGPVVDYPPDPLAELFDPDAGGEE